MFKALIVDDEPVILHGLRRIVDWDEHGIEIVAQVTTAAEALERLEAGRIHILLTDIRMPGMDGLELIRLAKLRYPWMRSVVLSGHDEFSYLQTAIKLGIENYLLKPVNRDELSETLQAIVGKLELENGDPPMDARGFRTNLIQRWLTRTIGDAELQERAAMADLDLRAEGYTVAVVRAHRGAGRDTSDRIAGIRSGVRKLCEDHLAPRARVDTFLDSDGDVVVLIGGSGVGEQRGDLVGLLRECARGARDTLGVQVFVSLGSRALGYRDAATSYTRAKDLQSYSLVLPPESIADADAIDRTVRERRARFDVDFSAFDDLLRVGREADCARFVAEALRTMGDTPGVTPRLVRDVALEIVYHVAHALRRMGTGDAAAGEPLQDSSDILGLQTIEELRAWLGRFIHRAFDMDRTGESTFSPLIRQVLQHVRVNRGRDLSIKVLAAQFNKNAAYLGQLFKQETGVLLSEHLAAIRIEEAKQLLRDTSLKTAEISRKVGYPNLNYFYRVFKKSTGLSPTEFRQGHSATSN